MDACTNLFSMLPPTVIGRLVGDELRRQRTKCPTGPRIAATLESLDGFERGITLVFADARTDFGILAILRTADLGPFTSSEITILTLGLDALSDRLSAFALAAATTHRREARRLRDGRDLDVL